MEYPHRTVRTAISKHIEDNHQHLDLALQHVISINYN